jgi:hypothetical protein
LIAVDGGGSSTAIERAMMSDGNVWRGVGPNATGGTTYGTASWNHLYGDSSI